MKTNKRASEKAIEYATRLTMKPLKANSNWEQVFDAIAEKQDLYISIRTRDINGKDVTLVDITKGEDKDPMLHYELTDADTFDREVGDWNWSYIYKVAVEGIMHPRSKKHGKKKPAKEEPEAVVKKDNTPELNIIQLRQLRTKLCMKMNYIKKKGGDYSEVEQELNNVKKQISQWKK